MEMENQGVWTLLTVCCYIILYNMVRGVDLKQIFWNIFIFAKFLTVCCCIISVILFSYCSPSIVIFRVWSSRSFFTAAFCCDLAVWASVCSFRALYCFCWIFTASWNCRRIWSSFCCNTIRYNTIQSGLCIASVESLRRRGTADGSGAPFAAIQYDTIRYNTISSFRALYCFCWIFTASWNCRRIWSSFCCNTIRYNTIQYNKFLQSLVLLLLNLYGVVELPSDLELLLLQYNTIQYDTIQ